MTPCTSSRWLLVLVAGLLCRPAIQAQEPIGSAASQSTATPATPKGVEVLARGPVHEAFATPTTDPVPTQPVPKRPPKPLDELPPDQKPEGDVVWISGYWAWDDDRKDFLWVSGIWRTVPQGRTWVAGYWREESNQWRWVPGFWAAADAQGAAQEVTYQPAPPRAPEVAAPGEPPAPDTFYVPGSWVWNGESYAWRAGYWARVQPGYVWVAAHYRWTPSGYVYIAGYWDLAVSRRGVLYAPVFVDADLVGPTFVYTPAYVVRDTIVIDSLFVRPCYCHYYFGDYYGAGYRGLGFESCVIYSNRCYDPIFVYERWDHRYEPGWSTVQLNICLARHSGDAPCPPRTLVQQNTIIQQNTTNITNINTTNIQKTTTVNNNQVLVPASRMTAATGVRTVPVDSTSRMQIQRHATAVQQVALQRRQSEAALPVGAPSRPRAATLTVPPTNPNRPPSSFSAVRSSTVTGSSSGATQVPAAHSPGMPVAGYSSVPSSASRSSGVSATQPSGMPVAGHTSMPYSMPTRPGVTGTQPFRPGMGTRPGLPMHPTLPAHPDSRDRRPQGKDHSG